MARKSGKTHHGGEGAADTVEMNFEELAQALGLSSAEAARQHASRAKWTARPARQGVPARVLVPRSALAKIAAKPSEPVAAPVVSAPEPAAPVVADPSPAAEIVPEPVAAPVVATAPEPVAPVAVVPEPVVVAVSPAPEPAPVVAATTLAPAEVVILPRAPGGSLAVKPPILGINREGWLFVGAGLLGWIVLGWVWGLLGSLSLLFAFAAAGFFRDPRRVVPTRPGLVVSPADGVVQSVELAVPPAELEMGETPRPVVRVFMNVFNVHVNRAPADGTVSRAVYRPGRFLDASLDKASEYNERVGVRLDLAAGRGSLAFVQIAGLVARRISNNLQEGQVVRVGERFGLIRFGSRLDVYLPAGAKPLVVVGQTAIAGETVLADLTSAEPARVGAAH